MCRDNTHGGRRCPHDTSEKRQARRVAERDRNRAARKLLTHGGEVWESVPEPVHYNDLPGIKAEITALQTLIREQDPVAAGSTDEEKIAWWDNDLEARITTIGKVLGARAEALIGFRTAEFHARMDEVAAEIYNPVSDKFHALEAEEEAIREELEPLVELFKRENPQDPGWRYGSWHASDFLENATYDRIDVKPYEAVLNRLITVQNAIEANREQYEQADAAYDARRAEIFANVRQELTRAYQRVIGELRETGGVIEFESSGFRDNYAAEDVLARTVGKHYPTAWLAAHNNFAGPRVVPLITEGRANFQVNGGYVQGDFEVAAERQIYAFTLPRDEQAQFERLRAVLPATVNTGTVNHFLAGKTNFVQTHVDKSEIGGEDPDTRPDGEGWVFESSVHGLLAETTRTATSAEAMVDSILKPRWYRPVLERRRAAPVLRIYDERTLPGDFTSETSANAVAYHEFGHRMEQVLPNNILPRQERAFLMRRANKSHLDRQDQYEGMRQIADLEYGHNRTEMGDEYMAREYFTGENYEVFTTGVEALYGQAYGGLQGYSIRSGTQDDEHRGFVLGTLAVL